MEGVVGGAKVVLFERKEIAMQRNPVKSSLIKSVGHDPVTNTLEVEFPNGVYRYPNVTAEEHASFIGAKSIGKHFGQFIKSRPFTKETQPCPQPKS